ncbi:BadF/BadG/BcrA/BcrD ATPase family protein [Ideonella sp. A 288]|uniref:BadF/BadG/BcrA/BcrD ATPase family protein n=1 Tax=Ideonella sp. A 288 TaxID=1962181 RepID=UPI001303B88F|nr:BadF/BadG/BcrA/BcrD ATPase family protein [Ideonella sp. A 288]
MTEILGLGLDGGGTQTRWALVAAEGHLRAQGEAPALPRPADGASVAAAAEVLCGIAASLPPQARPALATHGAVCAGFTGFDAGDAAAWARVFRQAFDVPAERTALASDIEMACRGAFEPGEGVLLLAGTGAIAGHVDAAGAFHRAGGRGVLIDDAGGGHWIAVEALRQVWRDEDERPGAGADSALGRYLFARLGGSDWPSTRRAVVGASRGEIGALALAVAAAAREGDVAAQALLRRAGTELARPARALLHRCGVVALAFAGRVFELGPAVEAGLRQALPDGLRVRPETRPAALRSAQRAALAALAARRAMGQPS